MSPAPTEYSSSRATISTVNPATGELLRTYPEISLDDLEGRLAGADRAYRHELRKPLSTVASERAAVLLRAAELLESRVDALSELITLEMGKTLASSRAEVLKCAKCCRWYAERGPTMLEPTPATLESGSHAEVRYEPLGTVLTIMPWNFPFWQVFRCAAPILLSGNSMLLKHASNVPGCAIAIEQIWREAFERQNLDPSAFATLLLPSSKVEDLIEDPRIRGVTLTGSEAAGRKVAAQAGAMIKKTVLELGGSDPFIVFESADLDAAVETAAKSRLLSNGQSCIAAKRFIVHESLYEGFRDRLVERFRKVRVGNPIDDGVELGPLATRKIRDDLHSLVADARDKGGTVVLGGEIPERDGFFYPATILEMLPADARIVSEEAFGPVATLYRFRDADEAFAIANNVPYGLGASIWTASRDDVEAAARRIESGQLFVNELVASDPAVPFGGVKASGYGRELGEYGLREWTIVRTLVVKDPKSLGGSGATKVGD
jgi:succinate-semialdehyde dehydrogenase/glutarate-semialdehyde dehydrogenase